MKRSLSLATLFLFTSILEGWGNAPSLEDAAPVITDSPFNQTQAWLVKESLLIWHPFEDGLDYGAKYQVDADSSSKMRVEIPDFKWGTGVRLTAGRYLPHHQLWDVTLAMTYFYAEAERTTHADPSNRQAVVAAFQAPLLGQDIIKAKARWQLNYFLWDLDIARSYLMTPKIIVHPHLGMRTALIYLDYINRNTTLDFGKDKKLHEVKPRFDSTNTMWGIGPRLGTDFSFNFKTNWSFLGSLTAALLYTNFSLDQSIKGFFSSTPINIHTNKSYNFLTSNLEASIGLGWETWVRKDTVRIATSFLFEASEWFNMNRLFHIETGEKTFGSTTLPISTPSYNRGDLGLIGFSINLQVDF